MAIWIAAHLVLLGVVGVPGYLDCRMPAREGCGSTVSIIALVIGWGQLVYGLIAAGIVALVKRTAVAQGILIGTTVVTFLFTAVCFGALLL
jgi:hypothetical protein